MKRLWMLLFVGALMLSCQTVDSTKTNTWLDSKLGIVAELNMTGKWDGGPYMDGGWGEGIFTQTGNKFSGSLGPYDVDGVVEGKTVYMVMRGGTKLYTAELTLQPDGQLVGKYVSNALIGEKDDATAETYGMTMKRMGE